VFKLYTIRTTEGTLDWFFELKKPSGVLYFDADPQVNFRRNFMKRSTLIITTITAAIWFTGCQPATNAPANTANTNTNTAKPAAAAPTADALLALERQANEAYFKGDGKFFEGMLSDKFVMYIPGAGRFGKAESVKEISGVKCDVKDGWKLEEPQMAKIDADTYSITSKGTFDGSCTSERGTEKLPSPVRVSSVYTRSGDKWLAVWHGENPIIDPNAPPPPPAKAGDKKAEPKPADKNANAAANSNSAANTAPAAPAKSANTEALARLHQSGWEAWKNKDAKFFETNLTPGFVFIDPIGGWHGNKADTIKYWTETMKCEGITKVAFTDAVATSISPTLELLTGKGTADGTCDGQKNGDLYTTAFYVKEGDAWKLAFMHESLPMPGM
jgi:ketosteroid isomerase-like protein